jgi:phage terminase small subunit
MEAQMSDDHVPALTAALAAAMSARTGQLTQQAVDEARIKAEELLPRDHPARAAVITFATMYEQYRRDAEQMRKQGEYLQDALGRALNPDATAPLRQIYGGIDD